MKKNFTELKVFKRAFEDIMENLYDYELLQHFLYNVLENEDAFDKAVESYSLDYARSLGWRTDELAYEGLLEKNSEVLESILRTIEYVI